MSDSAASATSTTFEEEMAALEQLVAEMESGQLPLEKMVARYAVGTQMLKRCHAHLEAAELKIEKLQRAEGAGVWTEEPPPAS